MSGFYKKKMFWGLMGVVGLLSVLAITPAFGDPDPSGVNTGTISDVTAATAGKPTLEEIGAQVGHNKISINMMWTLITGFIVMFMQAGFALVETGLCQHKNANHTMAMNMMIYPIGMFGFWVCGFALMFGGLGSTPTLGAGGAGLNNEFVIHLFGKDFGLFGTKGCFLAGSSYDVAIYTLFLFQMVFMDTTATIPTGAMAERWKTSAFVIYGFFISMVVYPLFGNWVWGGGWLSQLGHNFGLGHGHVDFAGSSVVHMVGGVCALAGAIVIGPRAGKFNKDGSANAIPAHNLIYAVLGTFILAFGWFGFNPGSTLAGTDLRMAVVATNTMLAGTGGCLVAYFYMWMRFGKPDTSMACNGMLAGLVAITAPCAFVDSIAAMIIGFVAGWLVVESVFLFEKLGVDDPVGAVSVHGVNGAWGCLALGIFADGAYGDGWNGVPGTVKGILHGDPGQFFAQAVGVTTCLVFVFIVCFIFFKVQNAIQGLRVPATVERDGLDIPEMGAYAYYDEITSLPQK